MLPERDRQDDRVGLECIAQRPGDDVTSDRASLRRQCLGRAAARDGHLDVLAGESLGESLANLAETYNCVTHDTSPICVDIEPLSRRSASELRKTDADGDFAGGHEAAVR